MIQERQIPVSADTVEHILREELADGDAVLASTRPILRQLLVNADHALFSDEVIGRVRGMIGHVARQLLFARGEAAGMANPLAGCEAMLEAFVAELMDDSAFLAHAHAMVLEAQLADQVQRRSGIDGVLSPLVQELAASPDPAMAAAAMRVIAAQARFLQQVRRMELPLEELPADLFHKALLLLRQRLPDDPAAQAAESRLRSTYDEGNGRVGQLARLIMAQGARATRALALEHAGLALFATALGMATNQDRNLTLLAFSENQLARLALALRAAGLGQAAVEEQFLYLHPDAILPEGFDLLTAERAAALLAASPARVIG